jgi:hypothetical protein
MNQIMIGAVDDAALLVSVEDRQPLAEIVDVTDSLVLETDVSRRED